METAAHVSAVHADDLLYAKFHAFLYFYFMFRMNEPLIFSLFVFQLISALYLVFMLICIN